MNAKQKKQLAKAIFDWRKAYKELETDPAVMKARDQLKSAQAALQEAENTHREALKENQSIIEGLVPEIGKSVTAFGIRAKFTKGYSRISFDSKVLDRIAQENVRFRNLVMPHRKESNVKPRVNLEVAEPEALLRDVEFSPDALEI